LALSAAFSTIIGDYALDERHSPILDRVVEAQFFRALLAKVRQLFQLVVRDVPL
jgi:hypothetical protein